MNILYILPSLKNKGPVVVAHDLVTLFSKHGHHCKVVYFDNGEELAFPCETERITMRQKVDFSGFDVVHAHGFRPQLYFTLNRPLWGKAGIKYVTTMHNYVFNDFHYDYGRAKGMMYSWFHLASCLRFDTIVTLSNDARRYYQRFFPYKHFEVAYNTTCCDADCDLTGEEKQQVVDFKGNSFLLGTCCVLIPLKRVEMIIRALPLVEGVKFLVVGDGGERSKLERLALQLGVADRVLFVGRKPKGYRYMKYLDAFTLTSTSEGFPLSLLEAASFGTPAITSDLPVYHELFTKKEIEIIPGVQEDDVVTAIYQVIHRRFEFSAAIRKKFMEDYSPEKFYFRYLKIYKR